MAPKTKAPELGATVHYFGNSRDQEARPDGAPFEPREARVEAVGDKGLTLRVHTLASPEPARFSDDPERFVVRHSVPHRSVAGEEFGTGELASYWDWPTPAAKA